MRWPALYVLTAGCNAVFGLQSTELVDAGFNDAPIDAPHMCPPIGTPLRFGGQFQQVIRQDCQGYNFSTTASIGVASCTETMPTYGMFPYQGTLDQRMTKVDIGLTYVDPVRIYPEGDRIFARGYATNVYKAALFMLTEGGAWVPTSEPLPPGAETSLASTFTRAPDRRVILYSYSSTGAIEYAQDEAGAWTKVGAYTAADWGCYYMGAVALSPDGLRVFASCTRTDTYRVETRYAERNSRSEMFGPMQVLEGAPANLGLVVINDDCSRAYFSALNAVFSANLEFTPATF